MESPDTSGRSYVGAVGSPKLDEGPRRPHFEMARPSEPRPPGHTAALSQPAWAAGRRLSLTSPWPGDHYDQPQPAPAVISWLINIRQALALLCSERQRDEADIAVATNELPSWPPRTTSCRHPQRPLKKMVPRTSQGLWHKGSSSATP